MPERRHPELTLPDSYASLPFKNILISHHPASSPTVTPIIILRLNRPAANNAWTEAMGQEIVHAFALFDADSRVKCIVVTGSEAGSKGGRFFCVGADLNVGFDRRRTDGRMGDYRDGGGTVTTAIHACRKPVIAALNGSAVGIGITMTLPCAIRIVHKKAKIGFVFGRRGLVMEAASSYFLPRLLGYSKAMHLVTTGSVYPSTHPLLSGLFSEIVDSHEQVLPKAIELAEEIASKTSGVSWALMRDMIYRGPDSAEESHLLDSKIIYGLFGSKDNTEGVKSFLEKREAKFDATFEDDAPEVWPWWSKVDILGKARGKVGNDSKL
jgi:enoyl-CoA hydratase/carnithine racemase